MLDTRARQRGTRRRGGLVLGLLSLSLSLLAACGGTPTGEGAASGLEREAAKTTDELEKIYDELGSVTGPAARRERLVKLAKEAGGEITWYTSTNEEQAKPIADQFEKLTGVTVKLYRAGSETVRQRAQQEAQAGRIRADNISLSGSDPAIAAREKLFAPLETPLAERVVDEGVFDTWVADQIYPFIPAWNTDLVPASKAPKDYQDLFTDFRDGQLAFEVTDADWLFGIVKVLEKQGMSEDEAITLVKEAARGGRPVDGHTLMAELLAAGEYAAVADSYHYRVASLMEDKAPLDWKPLGPVVADFGGSGISATAANPAGALLFLEYQLIEVQDYWVEEGRTPSDASKRGGILAEPSVEIHYVDYDALMKDFGRWQGLYEEMMRSSGRKVESD